MGCIFCILPNLFIEIWSRPIYLLIKTARWKFVILDLSGHFYQARERNRCSLLRILQLDGIGHLKFYCAPTTMENLLIFGDLDAFLHRFLLENQFSRGVQLFLSCKKYSKSLENLQDKIYILSKVRHRSRSLSQCIFSHEKVCLISFRGKINIFWTYLRRYLWLIQQKE